jgi:2-polyprenyl-3-methyl-5-hydroxy-6-metoxy-1,4-benzoquinol methylase
VADEAARCIACGAQRSTEWAKATDAEYRTTDETYQYRACAECGSLFIDPVPRDRLAVIYPSNYYSFATPKQSVLTRVKAWLDGRWFKSLLSAIPGDELSVLDVGGGAGWQLDVLKEIEPRIKYTQVVDLDPNAEREARSRGHDYYCGRIETFRSERKFDLVLMLNLIEHVDAPGDVLKNIGQLLSPNGQVLVKTPNIDSLDARLFRHSNWAGYHCPRHWVLFTRDGLTALAERSGLQVKRFSYTQGAPFWAASVLFWMEKKGLARISRERPVVYHPAFGLLSAAFAALDFARAPFAHTSQMFMVLGRP